MLFTFILVLPLHPISTAHNSKTYVLSYMSEHNKHKISTTRISSETLFYTVL